MYICTLYDVHMYVYMIYSIQYIYITININILYTCYVYCNR